MGEPVALLVVRQQYQLALECLTRGLSADEAERTAEASEFYSKGRQHLYQGLQVPTRGNQHEGAHWEKARMLQLQMRDTLRTIDFRISHLKTKVRLEKESPPQHLHPSLPAASPPTATQNNATLAGATTRSLPGTPAAPMGVPGEQPTGGLAVCSAGGQGSGLWQPPGGETEEELLFIPHGVQLFFVNPDGQVSCPSHPGYLQVVQVRGQSNGPIGLSAFLRVGDWSFPLSVDTPVLLANSGIFMFPDLVTQQPGSYIGIVLSFQTPAGDRAVFQDLLCQLVQLRVQAAEEGAGPEGTNLSQKVPIVPRGDVAIPLVTSTEDKPARPEWSETMADGILAGCTWLRHGLVKGSEVTGKAIQKGAALLRDRMTPEDTPAEVGPQVAQGLQTARQATEGAVRVSQLLVSGVCTLAGCVGDKLAPHIKKQGGRLIPESLKSSKDGRSNLDGAMVVAASSVKGLSAIWSGLETGAKNVVRSVANETVTTVNYKYGNDAATATNTAVESAMNVGVAAFNFDNLGLKGILKGTAKTIAKQQSKAKEEAEPTANRKDEEDEKTK